MNREYRKAKMTLYPFGKTPEQAAIENLSAENEWLRAVAQELAAAASLVLMRAEEQPGPFKQLIDGGSLRQALDAYNAMPNV